MEPLDPFKIPNAWDEATQYVEWTTAVFAPICDALGGDPEQIGPERFYGAARFYLEADEIGNVAIVLYVGERLVATRHFEWYAHAPAKAAEELLKAFNASAGS